MQFVGHGQKWTYNLLEKKYKKYWKEFNAPLGGLEPPTFQLTAERASQLRHRGSQTWHSQQENRKATFFLLIVILLHMFTFIQISIKRVENVIAVSLE